MLYLHLEDLNALPKLSIDKDKDILSSEAPEMYWIQM